MQKLNHKISLQNIKKIIEKAGGYHSIMEEYHKDINIYKIVRKIGNVVFLVSAVIYILGFYTADLDAKLLSIDIGIIFGGVGLAMRYWRPIMKTGRYSNESNRKAKRVIIEKRIGRKLTLNERLEFMKFEDARGSRAKLRDDIYPQKEYIIPKV